MVKMPHQIELLARVRLNSGAYIHELQRQRAFRDLEASQQRLTDTNLELALLNQKLEETTRFKSEFFANVSHELRTPLIACLGMAEILSDHALIYFGLLLTPSGERAVRRTSRAHTAWQSAAF